ncbi:hypothetical protein ABPG75_003857 [Micractinium tetrahymenae]
MYSPVEAAWGLQVEGLLVVLQRGGSRRELGPFSSAADAGLAHSVLAAKTAGVPQGPAAALCLDELADQLQRCADEARLHRLLRAAQSAAAPASGDGEAAATAATGISRDDEAASNRDAAESPGAAAAVGADLVTELRELLQEWSATGGTPFKLCYRLCGSCLPNELQQGLDALDAFDRAAVQLVVEACAAGAGVDACLAQLDCKMVSGWAPLSGQLPAADSIRLSNDELAQGERIWCGMEGYWELDEWEEEVVTELFRYGAILLSRPDRRLLAAVQGDIPLAVLQLRSMLSPVAKLQAWQGGASGHTALSLLQRHYQQAGSGSDVTAASAGELAEAIMQAVAGRHLRPFREYVRDLDEGRLEDRFWNSVHVFAVLVCDMGRQDLAAALLQFAAGPGVHWLFKELAARLCAHFGWPAQLNALLPAVAKQEGLFAMAQFLKACKQQGEESREGGRARG